MERTKALLTMVRSAALSLWALPAIALARGQGSQPGSTVAAPISPAAGGLGTHISAEWLWAIVALVALAIVWSTISTRRRATVTR